MRIWFDMDGTLADLFGVPNWEARLRAFDPSPYAEAGVMHNMSILARQLNRLKAMGVELGIISWLSKFPTPAYDEAVTENKLDWLDVHLHSVEWDAIYIVAYGVPKESFMVTEDDILFDDDPTNREHWRGHAYEPNEIFTILKELLAG